MVEEGGGGREGGSVFLRTALSASSYSQSRSQVVPLFLVLVVVSRLPAEPPIESAPPKMVALQVAPACLRCFRCFFNEHFTLILTTHKFGSHNCEKRM